MQNGESSAGAARTAGLRAPERLRVGVGPHAQLLNDRTF